MSSTPFFKAVNQQQSNGDKSKYCTYPVAVAVRWTPGESRSLFQFFVCSLVESFMFAAPKRAFCNDKCLQSQLSSCGKDRQCDPKGYTTVSDRPRLWVRNGRSECFAVQKVLDISVVVVACAVWHRYPPSFVGVGDWILNVRSAIKIISGKTKVDQSTSKSLICCSWHTPCLYFKGVLKRKNMKLNESGRWILQRQMTQNLAIV